MEEIKVKTSQRKSGGSKKLGRNTKKCARYRLEGRREKNKEKKRLRNIKREGNRKELRDGKAG